MEKLPRREREKLAREADILAAAEKLFTQHGFEQVTMDAVAKEAEFTKRTLYQYFPSKEDLFFAVVLRGFQQMFAYMEAASEQETNAFGKLQLVARGYYQFYKDHPGTFRLMAYVGYVKSKGGTRSPKREEWMKFDDNIFHGFAKLIESGKADGSIRADLDATQTAYALAFLLTGYLNMLSVAGTTFTTHFSLEEEAFSMFALDLLLDSVRRREMQPSPKKM